jgi:hypothetical protein
MIAVLASELDSEAQSVVADWSGYRAALLSARDLTTAGWEFHPADPSSGVAVIDGRRVPVANLQGVLTRRPAVLSEELAWLDPGDRQYVAAETNAFLVAWLSSLPCPVVNRPTTTSLCGPAWDELHWRSAAAGAGVDWAEPDDKSTVQRVVMCGERSFFAATDRQAEIARALAHVAGVDLLAVSFRGDHVCAASVAPPLDNPEIRKHLIGQLRGDA